jgi:hypothetical protein
MDAQILLPFVITGCALAGAFFVYRTPLDLQILLEQGAGPAQAAGAARWSFLGVRGAFCEGSLSISLCISGNEVLRRRIARSPGVQPEDTHPGPALNLGLLRYGPGLARIVRAMIRHLTVRKIEGDLVLGLRNPADTGIIYGFFSAVRPLIQLDERVSLSLQPAFDREVFTGRLTADLRIERPLVIPVLVFTCILLPGRFRMIREYSSGSRVIAA